MAEVSTKPYLIRAVVEWCNDVGFTPYVAVAVDETVRVPQPFVKNGEIVLNISSLATNKLDISNEAISFQARFGGVAQSVYVPIQRVIAVYARENGQGMAFEAPRALQHPADVERGAPDLSGSDAQARGTHLRAVDSPKQALTLAPEPDTASQVSAAEPDTGQDAATSQTPDVPKDGKSKAGRSAKGKDRPQLTRIK